MRSAVKIKINGELKNLNAHILSLAQALEDLGYLHHETTNFVVVHNQTLIHKNEYSDLLLSDQDNVEIWGVITGG